MRTFSCFTRDSRSDVPTFSLILAQSLERARELAARELMDTPGSIATEIVEDGQLLEVVCRSPALSRPPGFAPFRVR
jgi:hypothetical protein